MKCMNKDCQTKYHLFVFTPKPGWFFKKKSSVVLCERGKAVVLTELEDVDDALKLMDVTGDFIYNLDELLK